MSFCFGMLVCIPIIASAAVAEPDEAPGDADEPMVQLNFPPNVELQVLIEYVSERLDLNILYDRQIATQRVTLRTPQEVPVSSLRGIMESALRMNGLVLIDDEAPEWMRIERSDDLQKIARRAEPLHADPDRRPLEVLTAIYRLEHVRPNQVEPVIRPFLTQPGGNAIALADQRLLIVTDFASNMERLAGLVDLADQPPGAVDVQFVAVEHMAARGLAQHLTQLLQAKRRVEGREQAAIDVSADERTNQLVIIGEPTQVDAAMELAAAMDVPLGLETRVYAFQVSSPQRVDRLVRELLDPDEVERLYRSTIDAESNRLIVTTTADIHREVASIRRNLDVEVPDAQSPVRFYKLRNASASDVLATIRMLEGDEANGSLAGLAPPSASGNPRNSSTPGNPGNPGYSGNSGNSGNSDGNPAQDDAAPGRTNGNPDSGNGADPPPADEGEDDADSATDAARVQDDDESAQPVLQIPADPDRPVEGASQRERRAPAQQAVRTSRASVVADPNTNSLIVIADPSTQRIYQQLIEMLDRRRPQVLIETTIVTLDTSRGFSLGVEVARTDTFTIDGRTVDTLLFSSFGLSEVTGAGRLRPRPGLGFNGALLSPDIADVVVRALQTSGRAEVVSAPRVLVNDNATGTIRSENQQPYTSVNAFDTIATTSFGGFVGAGTTITMTPQIAEGDHLHLSFDIALRSFTGEGQEGIPPPRQTNEVSSEITVPDGHTIIVGGINVSDFSEAVNAVPILGEIPLIKHLFRSQDRSSSESTLFVFIRPTILRDDQFEDLKFLSRRDLERAGVTDSGRAPSSEPMLVR